MTAKMGGSTQIDSFPIGTAFTVDELLKYAILYRDNTAYYMLNQRYAFDGFVDYAASLGIETDLRLPKPRFGYLSARDAGLYFEDIYRFIEAGSEAVSYTHLDVYKRQDHMILIRHHSLVFVPEHLALAGLTRLVDGQVIGTEDHILSGHGNGAPVGGLEQVAGRQHQETGLGLGLGGQRHMHGHLVAVEVGVEGGADQGMEFDGAALDLSLIHILASISADII